MGEFNTTQVKVSQRGIGKDRSKKLFPFWQCYNQAILEKTNMSNKDTKLFPEKHGPSWMIKS